MLASIVTDSHNMTEKKRVEFMASGKAVNLVLSFVVARIGLAIFDEDNLSRFRVFLAILAAVTMALFLVGQSMIQGTYLWRRVRSLRRWRGIKNLISILSRSDVEDETKHSPSSPSVSERPRKLRWRRVLMDFASHQNFRAWVVAEMLLQAQITFNGNFLKTFVDHLLLDDFGRDTSDWLLSLVWPVTQIATIFVYLPMQRWGYSRVYLVLFSANFVLSHVLYWFVGESSTYGILSFLLVYSVFTRAVQSAGFHLAMADMVLEMKRRHAKEGRHDEPSVAGLFMGANALLCVRAQAILSTAGIFFSLTQLLPLIQKPVESILPMLAATVMESGGASRHNLFTLLVYPPMAFSVIQIVAWSFFDLTPRKTAEMRHELQEHQNSNLIDMLEP
jgi:Na+/melibiose symporter-like transporter